MQVDCKKLARYAEELLDEHRESDWIGPFKEDLIALSPRIICSRLRLLDQLTMYTDNLNLAENIQLGHRLLTYLRIRYLEENSGRRSIEPGARGAGIRDMSLNEIQARLSLLDELSINIDMMSLPETLGRKVFTYMLAKQNDDVHLMRAFKTAHGDAILKRAAHIEEPEQEQIEELDQEQQEQHSQDPQESDVGCNMDLDQVPPQLVLPLRPNPGQDGTRLDLDQGPQLVLALRSKQGQDGTHQDA